MIRILTLLDGVIQKTSRGTKLSDDSIRECFFDLATALKFLTTFLASEESDCK